ncbi:MAG: hypothetical protein ACR2GD_13770 [Pyrinomonadaceae bacterium]
MTKSKSVEAKFDEAPPQSEAKVKKGANLSDLNTNKEFVVYDYAENRTRRIGIIPAFLIALMFLSAISIFWVYSTERCFGKN